MKYSSIIFIALVVLFSSCNKEEEVVFFDFTGTYDAELNCTGEAASGNNGEAFTMVITRAQTEGSYSVDFSDEVVFNAVQIENALIIDKQTINEDFGFDVITMQGEIRKVDTEITVDIKFSVDDEGSSECTFPIVKL